MEQLIKDLLVYSQISVYEARATPVSAEKVLGLTVMNLQLAISDTGITILPPRGF
jgi:light-regulated signal transduction histidine kinase (bacteriophytochrome)